MVNPIESPPEPPEHLTDPRALLTGYLDYYRDALLRKLDGLTDEQLRTSLVPSGWTPLELLKHLTYVEIRWLRWGFLAEQVPEPWGDRGPGGRREDPWRVADGETLESLRTAFLAAAEDTRGIVSAAALEDAGGKGGRFDEERPTLIWILFHMLQEYARHVGQLDVVRELADGAVGE
ncbi:DinB family protein [Actinomadura atramentaria]|uniref:DinB family protein n=1 Tax=Actinomadura atramentaria TaxID=1990 RepID=UPI00037C82F6|nr:DinB family protein [Actinomadura atramentaria]